MKSPKKGPGQQSDSDSTRSSGGRGAANTGTKKASNARAALRQGEKAEANKAGNKRAK